MHTYLDPKLSLCYLYSRVCLVRPQRREEDDRRERPSDEVFYKLPSTQVASTNASFYTPDPPAFGKPRSEVTKSYTRNSRLRNTKTETPASG